MGFMGKIGDIFNKIDYREAYYGARQWIRLVKSWVSDEFWNAAMDPNIDTSTWGHVSKTPYLPHYKSVAFEDCDDFLMHFLWYAGAWTSEYSGFEEHGVINSQLYWYATDFGFIENGFHINDDDDGYRAFFDKVGFIGYNSLYKQGPFAPSDGLNIDTLGKIPQWSDAKNRIKQEPCRKDILKRDHS